MNLADYITGVAFAEPLNVAKPANPANGRGVTDPSVSEIRGISGPQELAPAEPAACSRWRVRLCPTEAVVVTLMPPMTEAEIRAQYPSGVEFTPIAVVDTVPAAPVGDRLYDKPADAWPVTALRAEAADVRRVGAEAGNVGLHKLAAEARADAEAAEAQAAVLDPADQPPAACAACAHRSRYNNCGIPVEAGLTERFGLVRHPRKGDGCGTFEATPP